VLIAITALARRRNLDDGAREREHPDRRVRGPRPRFAVHRHYGLERMMLGMTSGMFLLAVIGAAGASIYALVIAAES